MYGTRQNAFRASCMNQASVFEWYKRFKEGRESVRDDASVGGCKSVGDDASVGGCKSVRDDASVRGVR